MLKTLLAEVKEYKRDSILSPVYVSIEAILEVVIPYLMAYLVDKGIEKANMSAIFLYGFLMLVASFVSLWAGAKSGKHAAIASSGFAKNIRKAEYRNIQKFSFANIDQYSTSGLITRMMTDVTNVSMAYQMLIRVCVRSPLMLISSLIMACIINVEMTGVFLIVVLILGVVLFGIIFIVNPIFRRLFNRYDTLNGSIQENITGIRVVKSFVRQDHEIDKFKKESDAIFKIQAKAEKILVFNSPVMQFCMYGCILLISWLGAKQVVAQNMTTGELLSLFTYTTSILMSLMMLSMVFVMVTMSIASANRISEVLNQESDLTSPENGIKEVKDGTIDFENVSFHYGKDEDILENINLHVQSGSTLGVLGATGSSKSSFVQLIPRLYDVTSGSVKVSGIDVRDYDLKVLRDNVAMVLQKNVLFSGTIKENMRWGDANASDEEIIEACQLAQADEFIEKMPDKYDTFIEQGGSNVSGGQRQRLCIARALLKKPKILILDDSTSAVDTKTDALIRQAFLKKIPYTTRIIISQRVSSIQDADQIIVLADGKISGVGTHEELLASNAMYKETYEAQNKGGDFDEQ